MGRTFNIHSFKQYILNSYYVILGRGECSNLEDKNFLPLQSLYPSREDENEQCKYTTAEVSKYFLEKSN